MDPTRWPLVRSPAPAAMNALIALLIATTFVVCSGCAKPDWIDRTLVTVDVTGKWEGPATGANQYWFELEQRGTTVKGSVRFTTGSGWQSGGANSGAIDGSMAGDVFRFVAARGGLEGELTVSGDEMNGWISSAYSLRSPVSLQRADAAASPPR